MTKKTFNLTDISQYLKNSGASKHILNTFKFFEDHLDFLEANAEEDEKDLNWLRCLEQAGVDNWEGYGIAQDIYDEQYGEEEI